MRACTRVRRTFVHARIPNGHPREESAPVGGQVGEDRRAYPARGELAKRGRAGHADFRARILVRKLARMSVFVSVSVPWKSSLITRQVDCVHP